MKRPGSIILAGLCAVSFSVPAFAQAPAPGPGPSSARSVSFEKPASHPKKAKSKRGAKKHSKKRHGKHASRRAPVAKHK
jgi:hypothetical protein